ncbi:MAG: LamG domain-containing protein [Planctomycetota bacterium]
MRYLDQRAIRALGIAALVLAAVAAGNARAAIYEDTVLDDNPMLYWRLNETSGTTAADSSLFTRSGVYSGSVTLGAAGMPNGGNAVQFAGNDGRVTEEDGENYLLGETSLAIEIWLKADEVGSDRGILGGSTTAGGDTVLSMRYDSSGYRGGGNDVIKIAFSTNQGVQEYESASGVQSTEWQHLVINWVSGQGIELYVNGVLDAGSAHGANVDGTYTEGDVVGGALVGIDSLFLGESVKGDGTWLGLMDEFAVYDDPLSPGQIQEHYGNGIPEPATMLLLTGGALALLPKRRSA